MRRAATWPGRWVIPLLLTAAFAALAGWVSARGVLPGERATLIGLHRRLGDAGDRPAAWISEATDLGPLLAVAALVVVALLLARRPQDATLFSVAVAVVWVVNPLLKELFARPRPDLWPTAATGSEHAFPSGHAAGTAALVGALLLVLPGRRWRLVVVAGVVLLAVVAVSQLVLGRHYPSDILGGWLWAGAWIALLSESAPGRQARMRASRGSAVRAG